MVAPSPDAAVILPEMEALEAVEFVPCDRRATVGNANKISAIEIAQKALDTILRAIFIVFAVKSPKMKNSPPKLMIRRPMPPGSCVTFLQACPNYPLVRQYRTGALASSRSG